MLIAFDLLTLIGLGHNGAEDRNRTGTTGEGRRILSPVRLPVPPLRHIIILLLILTDIPKSMSSHKLRLKLRLWLSGWDSNPQPTG